MKQRIQTLALSIILCLLAPVVYAAFPTSTQNAQTVILNNEVSAMPAAPATFTHKRATAPDEFKRIQNTNRAIGYSVASLACAVAGIFVAGIPLGIAAIVLGIIGLNKAMKGLAIAGIILGAIDVVLVLAYLSTLK